jgi:hypothetical protein
VTSVCDILMHTQGTHIGDHESYIYN